MVHSEVCPGRVNHNAVDLSATRIKNFPPLAGGAPSRSPDVVTRSVKKGVPTGDRGNKKMSALYLTR
jgi:hypothetical protein